MSDYNEGAYDPRDPKSEQYIDWLLDEADARRGDV